MTETAAAHKAFNFRKILIIAVQVIIIGLLVWYFVQNRDVFQALENITWQVVVGIIVIDLASFLVNSYLNYTMIQRLDRRVTFIDCYLLQYVNNLLNKILPTVGGGAAFRAIFLKQKYQFPYAQFTSTVAGLYAISFFATALIGIVCLLLIYTWFHVFNWVIFLAFVGILIPTLAIILFSPTLPASNRRVIRVIKSVIDGWNIVKKDPKSILVYTMLTILLLGLAALQTFIVYQALGEQPNPVAMVYLSTLGIIMAFLNFTPDGIGVKEGIFIFSQELVQIPEEILVLGSIVLRAASIVTTFSIGALSYWILMNQVRKFEQAKLQAHPPAE